MPCVKNVLVVGGGIAGLAAAISLARRGIRCELVELSPSGAPLGAAITITGRAIETLQDLELLDQCRAAGHVDCLQWGDYDHTGTHIGTTPAAPPRPPPTIGLFRPQFARLLQARASQTGAHLRLGVGVSKMMQTADAVEANFTDGSKGRYDLLIGADGIRSQVRQLLLGDAIQPLYSGQYSVRWMAEGPRIPGPGMSYYGPTAKLVSYHLPIEQLTYLSAVIDSSEPLHVAGVGARELLATLLAEFSAPYVRELASRLHQRSEVLVRPFEWLLVPAPWHRGRVLLVGDAAHATTAHMASGGGMALEDAVVLGQCLEDAVNLPAALDTFMQRRFERARLVVDTSVELSRMEQQRATPQAMAAVRMAALQRLSQPY